MTTEQTTALAERKADNLSKFTGYSRPEIELIKATVAQGASDLELGMFLVLAKKYDLDPFAHEIWCYSMTAGGKKIIAVGHDGLMKNAQSHSDFLGIISATVREADEFEFEPALYKVHHKFGAKRGGILGAWARIERKEKMPAIVWVDYKEHAKPFGAWQSHPSRMIEKVARAYAIRMCYSINGVQTIDIGGPDAIGDDSETRVKMGRLQLPDEDEPYALDTSEEGETEDDLVGVGEVAEEDTATGEIAEEVGEGAVAPPCCEDCGADVPAQLTVGKREYSRDDWFKVTRVKYQGKLCVDCAKERAEIIKGEAEGRFAETERPQEAA